MRYILKTQRQQALDAVKLAPDDCICTVEQRTRSLEQNRTLWKLLTEISRAIPWQVNGASVMLAPEDWKDIITASLYQENRIARGINGGFVMLGRSTSKMTVKQMTELIEFVLAFAAEQGVHIDL
jgi:uncharacterized protein YjeT (DUF2065 family)